MAFDTFGDTVAISSVFGAEGMVLIDMASRLRKDFRVFTVDTEFLFPQTYNLIDKIEEKYKIGIERVYSLLSPEPQEQVHGPALRAVDPDQCCNLRKIEPLRRKLSELDAWITNILSVLHGISIVELRAPGLADAGERLRHLAGTPLSPTTHAAMGHPVP